MRLQDLFETRNAVAEATGDKPFDNMMKGIVKGTKKQAAADRREQKKQDQERARAAFGPNPADKLSIRKPGVAEGSVEEGVIDKVRAMNYDRLAKRSDKKVQTAFDKMQDFDFADPERFPHEKEFSDQMDKMGQRTKKANQLRTEQGVAEGEISESAFSPEEIAAINQYLDDEISFIELRRGYPGVISKAARQFGTGSAGGFRGEMDFYDRMVQARDEGDIPQQGMAEAIVGKPKYSEPHQSGRGLYSAADYRVRTNHQLGSHVYTAVTEVDGDNDRYYFIYQKGNKEPVFYATDMGRFEVRTDKLGNRISNAIMTAHREATDHDLEKYMSGDDESEWDQEKNMAEGLNEMDKSQTPPGRDGGHQFEPGPKVSKKDIKAVQKDPAKHLSDLFTKEYSKKKVKEQGVAEGNELGQILKYAGVSVKESMLTDSTGETLDHILNRFKNEVKRFQNGDEIDNELYDALFDYYNDHGEMPYGVAKARDGDPVNWISDKLTAELGIDENLIAAQSMPVTTESSSCNMTTEGEYCPEHGLAECGYMEDMAPVVMDEAPQDAINYNAAVTGAYYESKEGDALLARIKSLALLK